MHDLTGFQRDCLYTVAGLDQPHGLRVKEKLEDYYGEEVNHGRLYPNLDDLVARGFIEKGELDQRTNYYEVTSRGRRAIAAREQWEDDLVDTDAIVDDVDLAARSDSEGEAEQTAN